MVTVLSRHTVKHDINCSQDASLWHSYLSHLVLWKTAESLLCNIFNFLWKNWSVTFMDKVLSNTWIAHPHQQECCLVGNPTHEVYLNRYWSRTCKTSVNSFWHHLKHLQKHKQEWADLIAPSNFLTDGCVIHISSYCSGQK